MLRPLFSAALVGCLGMLVTACSPTVSPPEEPTETPPAAEVSPPFDVQAVIRRVSQAFRPEDGAFMGGQGTYAVRVEADGTAHFSPRHLRALEREPQQPVMGGPLAVRTASIARGGKSLLQAARASVREDGALALARGPVVEVLQNGEEGLEQRWELASKPAGSGDLEVRVELAGLEYLGETEQGHHYLDRRTGLGVRYGRATWVDAKGVGTAVEPVREGRALVMRVPARVLEQSAWPAVLDPVISPEISPDTPVPAPASGSEWSPDIAYGGGIYLVVWANSINTTYTIQGARVRASDGAVLDVGGITLATGTSSKNSPAVASDGSDFLVAWADTPSFGSTDIYGVRVRGSSGQVLDSSPRAISTATQGQSSPSIAFGGANYLVVWSDSRSLSSSDIYGARVRALDGAVLDSAGIPISVATNAQSSPSVAFDGSHFMVVWDDSRAGNDIYGARVRASDGVVLDPAGLPISTNAGLQFFPVIAFGGGSFLVAWDDKRNGNQSDVYGARVRPSDGAVIDPAGIAIGTGLGTQQPTSIGYDGNRFVVVWSNYINPSYEAYGARVDMDGVVLDPGGVSLFPTTYEQVPTVAFDGNTFQMVWVGLQANSYDIYGVRVRPSDLGALDTTAKLISSQANAERSPSVAAGASSYLVVWMDTRDLNGNYDVYGVRVRASDGAVMDPVAIPIGVASGSQASPSVAFDGSNFLVAWVDYRNTDTGGDIYGARVRESDGAVLDPAGIPISTAPRAQWPPRVTFGQGLYFVAWRDYRSGSGADVYGARVRASDGVVLDPGGVAVTTAAQDQTEPVTAFGGGSFLVAWNDGRNGTSNTDIYGARVRASDGVVLDGAGIPIVTVAANQQFSAVAFDGSNFLVAWQDRRVSSADIYGARVRASDGVVLDSGGFALCSHSSYQGAPALAFDGSTYLLVWRDTRNGVYQLNGSRVKPDGTLLDGTGFLIADMTANVLSTSVPAVASWGQGRFLVAYEPYDSAAAQLRVKVRLVSDPVNGARCESGPECTSGFCVDGVCCESACSGGTCGGGICVQPSAQITCPGNMVVEATSGSGATVSYPPATATGSEPLTVTYSQGSGTQFALGATTVTATVTDGLGGTDSCTFSVMVRDTTGPSLTCPGDLTVEATSTTGATVTYPPATASDAVSNVTVTYSASSGSHFDVGTTLVSVTATDEAGNTSTCSFTVTVSLPPAPQITCPGNMVAEATSGSGAMVNYPAATATGSEPLTVTYSQGSGTQFGLGTTAVTATATDGLGRTSSCSFSVTVRDTTAPSLSCGEDLVAEATGPSGAAVSYTLPTAIDAVTSAPTVSVSHASGSTFPLGSTQVTVTATDAAGNSATCAFSVTVRDTTAPSLTCPGDLTVEATSTTGATVTYPSATASDAVSNVAVTYSASSGSHFDVGTTPVSVTATDEAGNTSTCSFTVTVSLPPAPQITCPGNMVAEATSGSGATVNYPAATATGSEPLTVTYSQGSGTQFGLGTTAVTATATDGLGRTSSCSFSVTVRDTTAPSLSCGEDLVAEATGSSGAAVSYTLPTATDAITSAPTVSVSHASGSTFPLGSTQVTVTATDAAGNSATCALTITVRDTTAPVLSCPANLTEEATSAEGATVTYPPATASDTTSSPTLHYSQASGTRFSLGATQVIVTATDGAGQTSECSFTVTVRDTTPPALACGTDLVAEATGPGGASVNFALPTAMDAVSAAPSLMASHATGSLFPVGTTFITVTASDEAGNTASCTFRVTVQDTTAPTLSCPADVAVGNAPAQGMVAEYPAATSSDAVSTPVLSYSHASGSLFPVGTTQVTATATDASGNSATCSFQVQVDERVSTPPASEGCGCGAGSSTPAGLGWGALLLLAWSVARRRPASGSPHA